MRLVHDPVPALVARCKDSSGTFGHGRNLRELSAALESGRIRNPAYEEQALELLAVVNGERWAA
jgi:hypothetical protein